MTDTEVCRACKGAGVVMAGTNALTGLRTLMSEACEHELKESFKHIRALINCFSMPDPDQAEVLNAARAHLAENGEDKNE